MYPTKTFLAWAAVLLSPVLLGSTMRGCSQVIWHCEEPGSHEFEITAEARWPNQPATDLAVVTDLGAIYNRHIQYFCTQDEFDHEFSVPGDPYLADILLGDSPKGGFNIVVGENGVIVRYDQYGHNWTLIPSPTSEMLTRVKTGSDETVVAVGEAGTVIRSVDYGWTWELLSSPAPINLRDVDIDPASSDFIQVVGEGLVLYRTIDGGLTWQAVPLGAANASTQPVSSGGLRINRLYHQDGMNAYVAADDGILIRTTDNFGTFGFLDVFTSENLNDIYFVSADSGYLVGDNGTVRISVDGGNQWAEDPAISAFVGDASLKTISVIDSLYVIVLGDSGLSIAVAKDSSIFTSVRSEEEVVLEYGLSQNYPNPFNPTTSIRYRITDYGFVSIRVYDLLGREVAELVDEKRYPGTYEVLWDATGQSSGVYFYQLTAGSFVETKKIVLLR